MHARTIPFWLSLVALLALAGPVAADRAERPNRAFAGRIILSNKRFPTRAKSIGAFNAKVRKQAKTTFFENKENKTWKIYFASFLRRPLNDVEYRVKIYDLGTRPQHLLVTFDQFTDSRGQASLMSSMTLERRQVGVNKHLLMTVESKGKVLASARFKIVGEAERYTGKVDFSEEEAAGGGDEDEDEKKKK